jgi:hypothetical protein
MTKFNSLPAAKAAAVNYSKHSSAIKIEVRQVGASDFVACIAGETTNGQLVGVWQGGFGVAA